MSRVKMLIATRCFEEQPRTYIPSCSSRPDARLVGLCTGLIAASAIASADSLTALLPLAVEAVRIAFRTGTHVGQVAQQLECETGQKSWSTIVAADAKAVEAALFVFHEENVGPLVTDHSKVECLLIPGLRPFLFPIVCGSAHHRSHLRLSVDRHPRSSGCLKVPSFFRSTQKLTPLFTHHIMPHTCIHGQISQESFDRKPARSSAPPRSFSLFILASLVSQLIPRIHSSF